MSHPRARASSLALAAAIPAILFAAAATPAFAAGEAPVITSITPDGGILAGPTSFVVDLEDDDISYTYIELNRGGTWLTDNTKAVGSENHGLHPKLVVDLGGYSDGAYHLKVNAVDADGQTTSRNLPFTIDNTTPTVGFTTPDDGAALKGTVPVTVALDDANLKSFNLRLDSAGLDYAFQAANGERTFEWDTKTVADGRHTLLATATDKAGNKTTTTIKVSVDNTRPTLAITSPTDDAALKASAGTVVGVEASDPGTLTDVVVNLYRDGALLKSLGKQSTGGAIDWTGSWTLPAGLADGVYSLKAGTTDLAGNNRTVTRSFIVDSTRPKITIDSHSAGDELASTVTVFGTAADAGSGIEEVVLHLRAVKANGKLDGFLNTVTAPVVDGRWSVELDSTDFADGAYGVTVLGSDRAGNDVAGGGTHLKPLTIANDEAPAVEPVLKPSIAVDVSSVEAGGTITVSGADFAAGTAVALELHSTPVSLGSATATMNGTIEFAATIPASTPAGAHHVVAALPDGTTIQVPITVNAAAVAAVPAAAVGGLASTGFDALGLTLGAIATVLLGAGFAVFSLLRRRNAGPAR